MQSVDGETYNNTINLHTNGLFGIAIQQVWIFFTHNYVSYKASLNKALKNQHLYVKIKIIIVLALFLHKYEWKVL